MPWSEACICNRGMINSKTVEFFKITDSRTELRCARCKVPMDWWDEPSRAKKNTNKAPWSQEECLSMR